MILRILRGSLGRQRRRKVVAFAAVALGTAAASALLDIALGVGDKVNRELKSFGANLVVRPAGSGAPVEIAGADVSHLRTPGRLREADVLRAKENFWINNVLALAPYLDVPAGLGEAEVQMRGTWFGRRLQLADGRPFFTGVRELFPYWSVEGRWPADGPAGDAVEALAGRSLARARGLSPGDVVSVRLGGRGRAVRVVGILDGGNDESGWLLTTLDDLQALSGVGEVVDGILVSALTTPEDAAAQRLGLDPARLSPVEFERWSCTPFVSSVAYEIAGAVPGSEVSPIRRVADSEGRILTRISGLMALLAAMAALAAALTVASSLTTGILERRGEIGLLKAMGATNARVIGLFLLEAMLLGAAGGLAGAAAGAGLARAIATAVFGSPVELSPFAAPLAMLAAMGITLAGCLLPVRRISSFRPSEVLHGL